MDRFWVQAYRKGQHTQWFTESRWPTVLQALSAGATFARDWKRKVRVLDGETGKVVGRFDHTEEKNVP